MYLATICHHTTIIEVSLLRNRGYFISYICFVQFDWLTFICAITANMVPSSLRVCTAVSLLRNLSQIIADDYQKIRQNYESHIDKKLLQKIIQKKEAQGLRQTFE